MYLCTFTIVSNNSNLVNRLAITWLEPKKSVVLNQNLKCSKLLNNVGINKFNNDHNSVVSFWIGVPVSRSLFLPFNWRMDLNLIILL